MQGHRCARGLPKRDPSKSQHPAPCKSHTDEIPDPLGYGPLLNRLAILGNPDKMIPDVKDSVAGPPVVLHTASILKSSPKGEDFLTFPEGDNKNEGGRLLNCREMGDKRTGG